MAESGHFPNRFAMDQLGNILDGAGNLEGAKLVFTPVAGGMGSNVCNVTIQVTDVAGNPISQVFELEWFLSDSAVGAGLTATTASGTVGAGSAGTDVFGKVSKKAGDALTDATGKYVLSITDSAKTGFYVCAAAPGTGIMWVSSQLVTANYG